jgi:hypothetical protein
MAVTVPIRVASFILLASCAALCQQRPESVAFNSLPDAPSAVALAQIANGRIGTRENIPSLVAAAGNFVRPAQVAFTFLYHAQPVQKSSNDLFDKYLYPSLLKRNLNYRPSSSDNFMGRAMYAASRVFITRDESGKGRLNSSYFLGVLSAVAVHTAYRPYWARSSGAPISDFGSTMGNDAGMNLFHEFRPGLQQLMKNHAPKFVSKIEERVGRNN